MRASPTTFSVVCTIMLSMLTKVEYEITVVYYNIQLDIKKIWATDIYNY